MSSLELAKKRNRAAAERTLMAWIRTSLSLITFGFGIDKIVSVLNSAVGVDDPVSFTSILGLAFVSLGTLAMLAATLQHRQELKHFQTKSYRYVPNVSISFVVAIAILAIGFFAFFGILTSA
ncbi:MAG: DUF202 domain-containing protein [Cyanobacteria bacterium P01_D01_bin.1]